MVDPVPNQKKTARSIALGKSTYNYVLGQKLVQSEFEPMKLEVWKICF